MMNSKQLTRVPTGNLAVFCRIRTKQFVVGRRLEFNAICFLYSCQIIRGRVWRTLFQLLWYVTFMNKVEILFKMEHLFRFYVHQTCCISSSPPRQLSRMTASTTPLQRPFFLIFRNSKQQRNFPFQIKSEVLAWLGCLNSWLQLIWMRTNCRDIFLLLDKWLPTSLSHTSGVSGARSWSSWPFSGSGSTSASWSSPERTKRNSQIEKIRPPHQVEMNHEAPGALNCWRERLVGHDLWSDKQRPRYACCGKT